MTDTSTPTSPALDPTASAPLFDATTVADAAAIVARYPVARSALLPMLHLVQSVQGCVSLAGIAFCADQLDLTTAEVSAVATFYTMYKRTPCGEHLVSVCTNTLCAVLGGDAIYAAVRAELGEQDAPLGHEQTAGEPGTPGSLTLEHAECLAACDLAPVLQVNYEFYDNQTPEGAVALVRALRAGDRPAPTRGAPLTDFRDASRQLAGFFDRPGDVAGPSASPETLRGNTIAAEHGWSAPSMPPEHVIPPVPEKKP
ncbi:NADH-quinone oxidoreductase subunit NuoE [Rhodococcus antarcticus]|uniref:NADH-quinone oxidoreductase subunit NuoE n=1 Tax=Rhodococcus antarcticus TaxID=2987751 RepID=A0ABY6P0U3_9NOCA|nr:NADH-quinone oxidoreductase subunit NuoE [Rhodococcus antarcticus]UZJ25274.1 NADH-quinone oxidoreductase subunit NuoE [Rhodococcus antarcticus]